MLCPAQVSPTSAYTGVLAAAEYRRIALWEHSHLLSVLGAASTAAGRCISADAPPRPSTCFRFLFLFTFCSSRVSCVCIRTPSSFPPQTPKSVRCFFVLFLGFVFSVRTNPLFRTTAVPGTYCSSTTHRRNTSIYCCRALLWWSALVSHLVLVTVHIRHVLQQQ